MSQLVLTAVGGDPAEIVALERVPDLTVAEDDVLVAIEAAPINPADLAFEQGKFHVEPRVRQTLGAEAVGRVLDVGPVADQALVGRRVLILPTFVEGTWGDQVVVSEDSVVPVSERGDALQLAMLPCNCTAAWALLHEYVKLAPGEWVGLTLANSGFGQAVLAIARRAGVKTLAIVRREDAAQQVRERGAELVVLAGPDLAARVARALDGSRLRLLLDGGAQGLGELTGAVADGGAVVSYAAVEGEPPVLPLDDLYRGVSLHGFCLLRWMRTRPRAELTRIYAELAQLVEQGALVTSVEATYPLEQYAEAFAHACRPRRSGKVLFTPGRPDSCHRTAAGLLVAG